MLAHLPNLHPVQDRIDNVLLDIALLDSISVDVGDSISLNRLDSALMLNLGSLAIINLKVTKELSDGALVALALAPSRPSRSVLGSVCEKAWTERRKYVKECFFLESVSDFKGKE
jgi:hypothetical protein